MENRTFEKDREEEERRKQLGEKKKKRTEVLKKKTERTLRDLQGRSARKEN